MAFGQALEKGELIEQKSPKIRWVRRLFSTAKACGHSGMCAGIYAATFCEFQAIRDGGPVTSMAATGDVGGGDLPHERLRFLARLAFAEVAIQIEFHVV